MSRFSGAVWALVLCGSLLAIGAGFAGGRSYAHTALVPRPLPPLAALPDELPVRDLTRTLHGANSFDASDDDVDPYGDPDAAVAARPAGWAPRSFDRRHGRPQIAVLIVDADREATALGGFAAEPFPLTIVVPSDALRTTLRVARAGGKAALLDCSDADATLVRAARRDGAAGIVCSTDDAVRAQRLVAANGRGVVLDDRLHADALFRAAGAARMPALSRDVIADAREEPGYAAFLLAQALAIAQRSGVATVALHARDGSRRALERFAARAERDGAELVDVRALAR